MKLYKLYTHQKSFSSEDLLFNPKEHPNLKIGDVVEIYHPEDEFCRLLLQITSFNEELKGRETISIESSIASAFNLKTFSDVIMNTVNPSVVALDSVEITFKDQYMGRSEMWRLKNFLTNTCVYLNKKIEICEGSIRCQVYEMWSKGDRVACGVIDPDTKVVFRSSTSLVYLFIQMSSEMWDFDIYGDLYFEKAVNGFLTELFLKWKKFGCNHEVTIVLFSRTFYTAKSLDEFPLHMRECLQMDYKGRFYEDFYRVAIQNERNDDWSTVLSQLRKLFTAYQSLVLRYHERENIKIPACINSTAAQGNFLEVLNISLNAFEKHYLDRSFDRTGQLSVVITPGVGVFEVDRELTNITKQRIIDNGVGSDLVCVGEQPLHAVPLLKFHNKDTSLAFSDDYSMPHWINLSFYSTNKTVGYSTFVPRIKLPPLKATDEELPEGIQPELILSAQPEYIHNSLYDYDAYDAQIFQLPPAKETCSLQKVPRTKKTSVPSLSTQIPQSGSEWTSFDSKHSDLRRKMSDPDIHHGTSSFYSNTGSLNLSGSLAEGNYHSVMSNSSVVRPGRALINPFDPTHVTIKLTSNRRRWTHIFPKAIPTNQDVTFNISDYEHTATCESFKKSKDPIASTSKKLDDVSFESAFDESTSGKISPQSPISSLKGSSYLWGATSEKEWTPALTTGVDWKSLTIPACLPITTDYFPDARSLHNDYVITDYTLLPDDVNSDYANSRAVYRKPLTTEEVFKEIVSQRLAQGFQLIILEEKNTSPINAPCCGGQKLKKIPLLKKIVPKEISKEYLLSIGRIFHKISLNGSVITVTGYRPRHPYPPINVYYCYRFHAPHHETYEVSGVNFTTEKLENFNWNYMDHYICTRGDTDYPLLENLKYWRYRIYLLPKEHLATKKILEGISTHCDIYNEIPTISAKQQQTDFLRFVETHINKIKRQQTKRIRDNTTSQQTHLTRRRHSTSIISRPPPNQPERSVRIERPRIFSSYASKIGSKTVEEGRISPAIEAAGLAGEGYGSDDAFFGELKFSLNTPLVEIFEAMKYPVTGINFLAQTQSLPSFTFVSNDALSWLESRLDSRFTKLEILEAMRRERLICHASGDWQKPFIPGFHLWYIALQDRNSKDYIPPLGDLRAFENEWMEVEIQEENINFTNQYSNESKIPDFLRNEPSIREYNGNMYKHSHLEIDINHKSDRIEWGHVKYQKIMIPGFAFEIMLQWITASGPIVYDLVYGWSRKANQCNFQLVPIPADPFAEHFTEKSDPLRGPIFIPLNLECIKESSILFEEFPETSRSTRMILFQEAILQRFGFIPCIVQSSQIASCQTNDFEFVHCTGNMFILLRYPKTGAATEVSDQKASYTTRLVSKKINNIITNKRVGFLWSWNHMIPNKKWKTLTINSSPDIELFQLKLFNDFKEFCSNQDNRLINYWNESWKSLESDN